MPIGEVGYTSDRWKRVCNLSSLLLDSPKDNWEDILSRECGDDVELRSSVLSVCDSYSETEDFFGAPLVSPLLEGDWHIGQRIGAWKILRMLGEGGMGRVYLAERADGVFTQRAALKLNRERADSDSLRRFLAERRILAMLEHPCIARAIDGGATPEGTPYLVMEYVDGGVPIDEFQPGQTVVEKIRLFLRVVEAVEAAHRNRVAHRDLKPSNILVAPDGLPKIVDFGIAKLMPDDLQRAADRTISPHTAVTPAYGSPEQLLREPTTLSSDIYSLGAVLFKMLTGRPPHDLTGLNILESIRKATESNPAPPSTYAAGLDADLDAITLKSLSRHPRLRYASAAEFAADLGRYLGGDPVRARDGAWRYRASLLVRRHRRFTIAAAGCLLVLTMAAGKSVYDWRLERQRREELRRTVGATMSEYRSQLGGFNGTTRLRNRITSEAKAYLDSVGPAAAEDPELQRRLALAYAFIASHQTGRSSPRDSLFESLSLWRELAKDTLKDADKLEMAVVARRLGGSQISLGRLEIAGGTLGLSGQLFDSLRGRSGEPEARIERVMLLVEMSRLGAWAGNGPQAIEYARKAVAEHEKLPSRPLDRRDIALTRMQLADVADGYGSGDPKLLREALTQTRLAVRSVREAPACRDLLCREVKAAVLARAPIILLHQDLYQEALGLRDGVELAEEILTEDEENESALTSLRLGLRPLGWLLHEAGKLEESLKVRRRLLEVSMASVRHGASEDRLNEAIACGELGRILSGMKRFREARQYLDRQAEIVANPPTQNVYWYMRQTEVYQDLGTLLERMGQPAEARTKFAMASAAARTFLAKTGSARAKGIEAEAHFQEGRAQMAVDKAAGCALLRSSLERYGELAKSLGGINPEWETGFHGARKASAGCGLGLR